MEREGTGWIDEKLDVKIKLAALWASVMCLYIYADYFDLYVPGKLQGMLNGRMGPLGATSQSVLVIASTIVAIPSLMIFLSIALKPAVNRWLNMIMGILYTLIILVTMWGWTFFIVYGVLEVILTGLVFWYALKWPRRVAQ